MLSRLASTIARYAAGERSLLVKGVSLLIGSLVFLLLLPAGFMVIARMLAPHVGFAAPRTLELGVGGVAGLAGLGFVGWAALEQWRVGRGTPAQCAPTQRLITSGPYARCRNPIEFGAVLYYLGLGLLWGSLFHGLVLGVLGLALGSVYHRTVEERELEQRFGAAYVCYRQATPFLFPRLWRRRE